MKNIKKEVLLVLGNKKPKCAIIDYVLDNRKVFEGVLKINYSENDYEKFLKELNFSYDNNKDFDEEALCGTIWLDDNSWFEKGYYKEEWTFQCKKEIDKRCL